VPADSLHFWQKRLLEAGVPVEHGDLRFGDPVLRFSDPDGMHLELIGSEAGATIHAPRTANVPSEHSIRGFFGVTLCEANLEGTASVLTKMGFPQQAGEGNRYRFSAPGAALGSHIDILVQPQPMYGRMGAGSVHHIAFRAPDDAAQLAWREEIKGLSLDVTQVLDRTYFHSIYFREPGGVLFEIATDPPGFGFDEDIESLGEALKLPPWLEPKRDAIEKVLPAITLHHQKVQG
jgi:glyoxalase family protein